MRLRPLLTGELGFGLLGSGGILTALLAALNLIRFKKILISSLILYQRGEYADHEENDLRNYS